MHDIMHKGEKTVAKSRKILRESIVSSNELFKVMPFFLSEDYTLVDATIAPLLWRLPEYGIQLPGAAKPLLNYAEKVFARGAFQESLTESELEMRGII